MCTGNSKNVGTGPPLIGVLGLAVDFLMALDKVQNAEYIHLAVYGIIATV